MKDSNEVLSVDEPQVTEKKPYVSVKPPPPPTAAMRGRKAPTEEELRRSEAEIGAITCLFERSYPASSKVPFTLPPPLASTLKLPGRRHAEEVLKSRSGSRSSSAGR